MSVRIQAAGVEDAEQVLFAMRLAFEEYRGKLYPESGALRETLEDLRSGIARSWVIALLLPSPTRSGMRSRSRWRGI